MTMLKPENIQTIGVCPYCNGKMFLIKHNKTKIYACERCSFTYTIEKTE